ncbi:MAG: SGNH/GDSL hydrolase family protein [Rubripirellula sp.]
MKFRVHAFATFLVLLTSSALGQDQSVSNLTLGPYLYETKPDDPVFTKFYPRKTPPVGPMLLRKGDRLAIIGDSITEQKKYSRIIETYLTVCWPELEITARQYGWSGEKTDGFLRRMDRDCLPFDPTVATLCYGMNDSRYRPFDVNNGNWYRDHYTGVVRKLKAAGARVVVGSPGCAGKIASWVKSKSGTLDEHNLHLCALRDIALGVAESENVRFADIFWPMYQANFSAPKKYASSRDEPYLVAGTDGIHPGWAGHVMMAYAFLNAMGIDGKIGEFVIDLESGNATASDGHQVDSTSDGVVRITSSRYPFCAKGPIDDDDSIRSGMTLVPFHEQLNRFVLKVKGAKSKRVKVKWGGVSKEFDAATLADGIHLAAEFPTNPFTESFTRVDEAVAKKQEFETHQIKRVFHGKEGRKDFEAAVKKTEAQRQPLAYAIASAMQPVSHQFTITLVE